MANTADVIVVGLGAMGSAALYQAAKLGARSSSFPRMKRPSSLVPPQFAA